MIVLLPVLTVVLAGLIVGIAALVEKKPAQLPAAKVVDR